MSGARTELPTPRRLREARRRGQVAWSRELTGAIALVAGLAAVAAGGPFAVLQLSAVLRGGLTAATAGEAAPLPLLGDALVQLARVAAPLLLFPALAATAAAALQAGGIATLDSLRPRLDRLDPLAGLRRLASAQPLLRAALGLGKAAAVVAILWSWFDANGRCLGQLPRLGPASLWRGTPLGALALRLGLTALAFGAIDLALARRRHRRALMMTRDEVRREAREDQGDPQHRAERLRVHRALLEAGPVARATVVVVNPTRIAVALQHRRDTDAAPRVLAKGTGAGATRIRSAARRAGVPVVRDIPLARALYRLADAGDEIPAELYDAAAGVLVHVYGLDRERA